MRVVQLRNNVRDGTVGLAQFPAIRGLFGGSGGDNDGGGDGSGGGGPGGKVEAYPLAGGGGYSISCMAVVV